MSGIENTSANVGRIMTPSQLAKSRRRAGKNLKFGEVRMDTDVGKQLSQRQWTIEKLYAPRGAKQIASALRASDDRHSVMMQIAEMSQHGKFPVAGTSKREILKRHLVLEMAAGLLDDTAQHPEWLLVAACVRGNCPGSSEALLRKLKTADTDENTFASLFESVVESHGDKSSLRKMLFAARRHPRLLAAVLRQSLGLNHNQAFRRRDVSVEELAQDILACGDNIGLLTALADSLEGIQGNPLQNAQTLKKLRGDAHKLAEFVRQTREAAGRMHKERDAMRTAVHEAIRESELLNREEIRDQYGETDLPSDRSIPELLENDGNAQAKLEESTRFISLLRNMLNKYEIKDFNEQLGKMKNALGADVRAEQRSDDSARRADILNRLSSMHLSSSFLMMVEEFESNIKGITRLGNFAFPDINGKVLIQELLNIIESGTGQPSKFEGLLTHLGLGNHVSASIVTLQGIMGILRTLPDQTYPSVRTRTQMQEAAQTVLEAAILREEEMAG